MIFGVKKIAKYLLGTDVAGRGIAVRHDDTFVCSYPRSGNTWTRFLIANILYPDQQVSFANIERMVPDADAQSSRYMKRAPSPRVIKSHQYFDHRYPKVIYIVRDPRDVVLSYYDFSRKARKTADDYPIENYVGDFVNGRLVSASWGTWGENVSTWVSARHNSPRFLLLRYEQLLADTEVELARVASFMGICPDRQLIQCAVERSSAGRMRQFEKKEGSTWVSTKNKRTDIAFVGTAISGKWKSKLPAAAIAEIESAWGDLMVQLGYELNAATAEPAFAGPGH
jgi:hypothetical protein